MSTEGHRKLYTRSLQIVLYADDTLLIGYEVEGLPDLLEAVSWAGTQYGMSSRWSKFMLLGLRAECKLTTPDGQGIPPKDVMSYLGATVHMDGALARELAQKLGIGWAEFSKSSRLCKHTALTAAKKIHIYHGMW